MQSLARTSLASSDKGGGGTSYAATAVASLLISGYAEEDWRFDRLDRNGRYVADLTPYVDMKGSGAIDHDATRAIKRSLRLGVRADSGFDFANDLIRPRYRIRAADGGWLDWPQGIFLTMKAPRRITKVATWVLYEGSDILQLLSDNAFQQSYSVASGFGYYQAAVILAQAYAGTFPLQVQMAAPAQTLPQALGWEAGKTPLLAITDLLAAVNYTTPWADENGMLRSASNLAIYQSPPSFTFTQVATPISDEIDYSVAYNVVTVMIEDPRRVRQTATYTNSSPLSPISTVRWRTKPAPIVRDSRIVDLSTAAAYAQYLALEFARVYETVKLATPPWPVSQNLDVYGLQYSSATEGSVNLTAVETKWRMPIKVGAPTEHELSRIT